MVVLFLAATERHTPDTSGQEFQCDVQNHKILKWHHWPRWPENSRALLILWLQRQATCFVHLQPLHSDFLAIVDPNHHRVRQEQ